MLIKTPYDIGEIVYVKNDPDQFERIITGMTVRANNLVSYELSLLAQETHHYDFEISREPDQMKKLG